MCIGLRTILLLLFSLEAVLGYQWSELLLEKRLESTYLIFRSLFSLSYVYEPIISDKIALNVNADEAAVLGTPAYSHSSRLEN
jgi:hypothetical protein